MTRALRIAYALIAVNLMPAVVAAQKVTYDFHKTADFAQVTSFTVKAGALSDSALVNERFTRAISSQLQARGMSRTDNPDVYIIPSLKTESRKTVTAYNLGYGYGYGAGWYGPWEHRGWYAPYGLYDWGPTTYEVRDTRYDTLTIDMVDAKTGALLWRGQGIKRVNPYWKPDKVDRKVNDVVTKVLSHFPPGVRDR